VTVVKLGSTVNEIKLFIDQAVPELTQQFGGGQAQYQKRSTIW
jgi:hypothetical protein